MTEFLAVLGAVVPAFLITNRLPGTFRTSTE